MARKATRRNFLQAATGAAALAAAPAAPAARRGAPTLGEANIYTSLGIRPLINGIGTVTVLGGSIMPPEVVRAMDEASKYFVHLPELQKKAGARIAELLGVPAAMVTAGAASAITVGTAACVVSGDRAKLHRLPDTSDMKNEIIQQKTHRSGYEAQMLVVGTKIVWVETREELDKAINERTAMMFFLNKADPDGQIKRSEWIQVARQHGIPTYNDAAADVPPPSNLSAYVKEGFDLVGFSGGKGLLGPQCSGLLLGRQDLIEAAMPAISPHDGIGRGMKVGKEEIMGVLAALERYLKVDQAAEQRVLEDRAAHIMQAMKKARGVTAEREVPEIANHVPHVRLTWDEAKLGVTAKQVVRQLLEGDPPIGISQQGEGNLMVSVWMMQRDEHRIVAARLREVLRKA
ncbi:MAG TPA: aminotransferase class V-fold PLP-dependent enzyme [Bryobacterales bacterium]|nr:aminotransferase class V-fold PLP-dependent enzyme [Bryobacterales bacterium]